MASIRLTRYEAEEDDLPGVCMRCGAPATVLKRRMFVSHPVWVYVLLPFGYLPYAVVAAVLTQRVRCYTHFCDRHKNHWFIRGVIIWGGLLALLTVLGGSFAIVILLEKKLGEPVVKNLVGLLCVATFVVLFGWVISIPIMQLTAIHPAEVTERGLTLKRVSPAFVEAVQDYRELPRDDEEDEEHGRKLRPRRRDASEEIYDPERRRQGRGKREAPGDGA